MIYLYSAHRAVIFAIAQLSCFTFIFAVLLPRVGGCGGVSNVFVGLCAWQIIYFIGQQLLLNNVKVYLQHSRSIFYISRVIAYFVGALA